ncbi:hypothetical protein [Austwickia chelonae]|uniref:hypothetical protein n=1 Tax=Austwickia chelonae TaxID=100225 RepID=UPI000E282608|nr:hypothetical protein [Austwickia chelonae]
MKDLARETAEATEEVEEKVRAIQEDAGSVVQALCPGRGDGGSDQGIISGVLGDQNRPKSNMLEQD